jgi:mono/diheme cytochrome c family protein
MSSNVLRALGLAGIMVAMATFRPLEPRQQPTSPLILESVAGRDSYEFYCASCHGKTGQGDGPVASALKTRPTDLTSLARRSGGAFPKQRVVAILTGAAEEIAAHGSTDMPVWGRIFRGLDPSEPRVTQRIENMAAHIEALQAPSTSQGDRGARLFRIHCATCHGTTARGDGPLAEQLRRVPPDLTQYTARNSGVFPTERVHRIIDGRDVPSHGNREMPVWGDAFRESREGLSDEAVKARIEAIVTYLRGIQQRAAL